MLINIYMNILFYGKHLTLLINAAWLTGLRLFNPSQPNRTQNRPRTRKNHNIEYFLVTGIPISLKNCVWGRSF